jgi:hypothetical protein
MMKDTQTAGVVPFGKYKGQPIESMRADAAYCDWLMAQNWFRERYTPIYQIIVNNFGEPSETPEHNRLQARFLDDGFCLELLRALGWVPIVDPEKIIKKRMATKIDALKKSIVEHTQSIARYQRIADRGSWSFFKDGLAKTEADLASAEAALRQAESYARQPDAAMTITITKRNFEVGGWDVSFGAEAVDQSSESWEEVAVLVEIKPTLGDDYPACLRQMKANRREYWNRSCCLVFDQFAANGASLEQVREIFCASGFGMVSLADIEAGGAKRGCVYQPGYIPHAE